MDKVKKFSAVFPGQASQYIGMGREFIEDIPECADVIKKGEDITALPLMTKIMQGPMEELTRTLICQPAVFAVNLVCWYAMRKKGLYPFSVAGHSLGEYSALVASEVVSIEDGFYLVKRRAEIMDEISSNMNGGLMAVIGLPLQEVEPLLDGYKGISVANINSYKQIVVGGSIEDLENFASFLKTRKTKGVMLKVSGAFHTSFMKEASSLLAAEIEKITFKNPVIPVYLNFSGEKAKDKEEIKKGLIQQMYSPVRWVGIVENINKDEGNIIFVEVGPKTVLKKLIEGILSEVRVLNIEDKASLDNTYKELA